MKKIDPIGMLLMLLSILTSIAGVFISSISSKRAYKQMTEEAVDERMMELNANNNEIVNFVNRNTDALVERVKEIVANKDQQQ